MVAFYCFIYCVKNSVLLARVFVIFDRNNSRYSYINSPHNKYIQILKKASKSEILLAGYWITANLQIKERFMSHVVLLVYGLWKKIQKPVIK